MSADSEQRIKEMKECLTLPDAVDLLGRTIDQMLSKGLERSTILNDLEVVRAQMRASGEGRSEDIVMDVMDFVVGWCNPNMRLPSNDSDRNMRQL